MTMYLLTPEQVAQQLSIDVKKVSRLPITRVRIGTRIIRYRQEDVDLYVRERLESPGLQSQQPGRRKKKKDKDPRETHMGLISREALDRMREADKPPSEDIEVHSAEEKRRITRLKSMAEAVAKKREA